MICDEDMRQRVDGEVTAIRRFFEDAYQHDRDNIDKNWPKLIFDKYYNPSKYKKETVEEKKTLLSLYEYYLEMHPLSDIRIRNNRVVMRVLERYELFSLPSGRELQRMWRKDWKWFLEYRQQCG